MDEPESPFICKICYSNYDDDVKKPVILTPCSHTICKSCLGEILLLNKTCPFCKKEIKGDISEIKPNYELVDIIYQLKNNTNNNVIKCGKCKEIVKIIYIEEKNSNVNFLCKKCAEKEPSEFIMPLEEVIKKGEDQLEKYKTLMSMKINKEFIKNEICNFITKYLKKTVCELIDQKKELFETFIDLPDFLKMIEKYKKSLENALKSKENSLHYLQQNSTIITPTIKDAMINNILNLNNVDTNDKLNQKINLFEKTIEKEFNKNKIYLQSILQNLTNEIIYQSNIVIYNTCKESLKDDISILERITMNNDILNNTNSRFVSSNFQHNHIQFGSVFSQMQLQQQLSGLEMDDSSQQFLNKNKDNIISENNNVSIIGLIKENHKNEGSLKKVMGNIFNCECKLFNKDKVYYGCQLVFPNKKSLEKFMDKKKYTFTEGGKNVVLFKKENKTGNRLYVKYI